MTTARQILARKGNIVFTIQPEESVIEALRVMAERNIGALVVVDASAEVVGVLSERDYARNVVLKGRLSKDTPVADIMNDQAVCIDSEKSVEACMTLMTEMRTRHLPVLENGQLTGLISMGDVVKAVIEHQQVTIEELEHYITGTPRWE